MKLLISTFATKSFCYALHDQARRVAACLAYAGIHGCNTEYLFVSDGSQEALDALEKIKSELRFKVTHRIIDDLTDNNTGKHVAESNMVIARMQDEAFTYARRNDFTHHWTVEADILPNANALQSLIDTLTFDRGWYSVAMAAYPNSLFLGGKGSPQRHIYPNVYDDERKVSKSLQARLKSKNPETAKKAREELEKQPSTGNVFVRQAKGWRPRGWLEECYPGIGRGAIVPTDWFGFGCTLFDRRAIELANWTGYLGAGTQDLWLGWRCFYQHDLRFAVVPHALATHVKRIDGVMTMMHAYHEMSGDAVGHLRTSKVALEQKNDRIEPT